MSNRVSMTGFVYGEPKSAIIGQYSNGKNKYVLNLYMAEDAEKDKDGKEKPLVCWNVSIFGPRAAYAQAWIKKGDRLAIIDGVLSQDEYTGKDGIKRVIPKITVNSFDGIQYYPIKGNAGSGAPTAPVNTAKTVRVEPGSEFDFGDDFDMLAEDDDVPF